jgi:L-ascorbate metabolism protein UlaG (beta-lactamase superfamily)
MENIKWLGHASFVLKDSESGKTAYIDPFKISDKAPMPADIILITHPHYDHCSEADIRRIQKQGTVIIAPADCRIAVKKTLLPGQRLNVDGITVEAVPAYNVNKSFHPKQNSWVGYVVTVGGRRIYHAGDTDFFPEMETLPALRNVDAALLPIGGTYTMNAEEAAKAADAIKPKIAVPMHYGTIVGGRGDAEKFKELCKCRVEFLD